MGRDQMFEAFRLHGLIAMCQDFGPILQNTARTFIVSADGSRDVVSFVDEHQNPPSGWDAHLGNDDLA